MPYCLVQEYKYNEIPGIYYYDRLCCYGDYMAAIKVTITHVIRRYRAGLFLVCQICLSDKNSDPGDRSESLAEDLGADLSN